MGTKDQATCADRVLEAKDSRLEDLRGFYNTRLNDDMRETIYQYPLYLDYVAPNTFDDQPTGYLRYQISWGGPAEEIRTYLYECVGGAIATLTQFWFMDWFDGAHVALDADEEKLAKWAMLVWYQEHLEKELKLRKSISNSINSPMHRMKPLIKLGEIITKSF